MYTHTQHKHIISEHMVNTHTQNDNAHKYTATHTTTHSGIKKKTKMRTCNNNTHIEHILNNTHKQSYVFIFRGLRLPLPLIKTGF